MAKEIKTQAGQTSYQSYVKVLEMGIKTSVSQFEAFEEVFPSTRKHLGISTFKYLGISKVRKLKAGEGCRKSRVFLTIAVVNGETYVTSFIRITLLQILLLKTQEYQHYIWFCCIIFLRESGYSIGIS